MRFILVDKERTHVPKRTQRNDENDKAESFLFAVTPTFWGVPSRVISAAQVAVTNQ